MGQTELTRAFVHNPSGCGILPQHGDHVPQLPKRSRLVRILQAKTRLGGA